MLFEPSDPFWAVYNTLIKPIIVIDTSVSNYTKLYFRWFKFIRLEPRILHITTKDSDSEQDGFLASGSLIQLTRQEFRGKVMG